MEKNECWICPECGSEVKMNKNKCWRCDFTPEDVSKYKYDKKAELVSNVKKFAIVLASLIAFICVGYFSISAIGDLITEEDYMDEQTRREIEAGRSVTPLIEDTPYNGGTSVNNANRTASFEIENLEKRYKSLLWEYLNLVKGKVPIEQEKKYFRELKNILININSIATKANMPNKKIKDIDYKIVVDTKL